MTMLRQLADAGRVVLVVTHSLTYLDVCDQVCCWPPAARRRSTARPARSAPDGHHQLGGHLHPGRGPIPTRPIGGSLNSRPPPPQPPAEKPTDLGKPAHSAAATVLYNRSPPDAADRLRPRLLRLPGGAAVHHGRAVAVSARKRGFGYPFLRRSGRRAQRAREILVLLNVGAIFMGTALTIRDLIGERAIFRREQAVGLSTTAYLLAKVCVFCRVRDRPVGDRRRDRRFGKGGARGR